MKRGVITTAVVVLLAASIYVSAGLWNRRSQTADEALDDEVGRDMLEGRPLVSPQLKGRRKIATWADPGIEDEEPEESDVVVEERVLGVLPDYEPMVVDEGAPKGFWPGEPEWDREKERYDREYDVNRRARVDRVMKALVWFMARQSPNGGWEAGGFNKWCKGESVERPDSHADDLGRNEYDIGVTGLVVCAYLGAGYTNRGKHPFRQSVSKGLRYLKNVQDPYGCFGPRDRERFLTNHALASLAMVEAYGMTLSPIFKGSAQRSLDFTAKARNVNSAWGYRIRGGSCDAITTGLSLFPIHSARIINRDAARRGRKAPLAIDEKAFEHAVAWLDSVTEDQSGLVGYARRGDVPWRPPSREGDFPPDYAPTPTVMAVLARVFDGADPKKDIDVRMGLTQIATRLPRWSREQGSIDALYWWQGTLAAWIAGGRTWTAWKGTFEHALLETQRDDDYYCHGKGSWDPVGAWGDELGRVGTTALMTMCLEVYYRYDRVFGSK